MSDKKAPALRNHSETAGRPGQPNQSVERALAILNYLAERVQPSGVREIARHFGYSPSIAQRLLSTMAAQGFLEQRGEALRYAIGYRAFVVGQAFLSQSDLLSAAAPELKNLSEQQITGFLGTMRDGEVVHLAVVQANGPIAVKSETGSTTHLHSTALGKVMLASLPDDVLRERLMGQLEKVTDTTITSLDRLLEQLSEVRSVGYAVNDCENGNGVYAIGVAIRNADNATVAALSGAVPRVGLDSDAQELLIRAVVEAGQRVSLKLGAKLR